MDFLGNAISWQKPRFQYREREREGRIIWFSPLLACVQSIGGEEEIVLLVWSGGRCSACLRCPIQRSGRSWARARETLRFIHLESSKRENPPSFLEFLRSIRGDKQLVTFREDRPGRELRSCM
ncbi:hypothetical protein IEQ34_017669 [Dendrobium chrysotoxum]|uniref:Uncharacterized protein n=1 Tax=Dendrobium chrysotoxum TaxID=161865 RepID=A0AAV7FUF2_DENCH|nr:hypothetical protein IEQ34_017669 [Dendrobium chrysotoxum]